MAEIKQYTFTYQEVVEALIKKQGLHEGIWAITFELAVAGATVQGPGGELTPAAVIPIAKVGLQKVDATSPIAVDAAVVNPVHKQD